MLSRFEGSEFFQALKLLHDRVTKFVCSRARYRTDFEYRAVPLQLLQKHLTGNGEVVASQQIDLVDNQPAGFLRQVFRILR